MKRKAEPAETEVRDNRRRGVPLPGCDCVQCFGYCLPDRDAATREFLLANERRRTNDAAD